MILTLQELTTFLNWIAVLYFIYSLSKKSNGLLLAALLSSIVIPVFRLSFTILLLDLLRELLLVCMSMLNVLEFEEFCVFDEFCVFSCFPCFELKILLLFCVFSCFSCFELKILLLFFGLIFLF